MPDPSKGKGHKLSKADAKKANERGAAAKGGRQTARGRDKMTLDEVRQKNHEDMAEDLRKMGR